MAEIPALSLVIGAASSGKSRWAEGVVRQAGRPKTYIATAQPLDDEMIAKIGRHRRDRGQDWHNIEAPLDLVTALCAVPDQHVVLVDCLTMWLSNQMLAETDISAEITALLQALTQMQPPVVLVTGEVGASVVPDNALARRFQSAQGQLNQRLAARADLVVAVIAGLPLALKGSLLGAAR